MSLVFVQLAADNFNRANENPLANGQWTTAFGSPLQIVSNACESVGSFGASQYTGIVWPNDQWAEIKITALAAGSSISLIIRVDAGISNYLELDLQGASLSNAVKITKTVAGVQSPLATFPAPSVGELYRIAALGTNWYLFKNGTQIGTGSIGAVPSAGSVYLTISDTAVPSDTTADNFAGGSVSQSLPYSVPDCRVAPAGPNASRTVQGTAIYDVQTSSNHAIPSTDSRAAGALVDSRISPNIPQNSRTPGTFGPGE